MLMPVIRFKPVGVDGTGGFADIVVPTMGGNFVPELKALKAQLSPQVAYLTVLLD